VAENEGKRMARGHTVVGKPNIRVAHAAAGHLDDHFFRTRREAGEVALL
jgi:hypothetical protein